MTSLCGCEPRVNIPLVTSATSLEIFPIPCLSDNYAYALIEAQGAWIVDPSEAEPVEAFLKGKGLSLLGILLTHHHWDHVGGVLELVRGRGDLPVVCHSLDASRVKGANHLVDAPADEWVDSGLKIAEQNVWARHIPGHTRAAIAWKVGDSVFTGDTLFAAGCGYLFEGSAQEMYASLRAICEQPDETRLWFGHEYTAANLRFARVAEPNNADMRTRLAGLREGECTSPSSVAQEKATNPFVRARDAAHFGELRNAKNNWKG